MLNPVDKQFHNLYQNLLSHGHVKGDRTGHGTLMLPGQMLRLDCRDNKLPILSTRFIPTKAFRREMLWFMSGNSSIKYLRDHKVGIWDSWFIPGTDVYDEPVVKTLTLEERVELVTEPGGHMILRQFFERADRNRTSYGSAHYNFKVGGELFEWNNQPQSSVEALHQLLDDMTIPAQLTPEFTALKFKERVELAVKAGKGPAIYGFTTCLKGHVGPAVTQIQLIKVSGESVQVGLGEDHVIQVSQFLDQIGVEKERKNGSEKISLQRRLARVSKNDTAKWDAINEVAMSVLFDKQAYSEDDYTTAVVFYENKFRDARLSPRKVTSILKILDDLKVPAYELLDADIGQGGYGPLWRNWKDTQVVPCVYGDETFAQYTAQGYENLGAVESYGRSDRGGYVFYREIDQLQDCIDMLLKNPDDRRMIVAAQNPATVWQAALQPCHNMFQFVSWEKTLEELWAEIDKVDKMGEFMTYGQKLRDRIAATSMKSEQIHSKTVEFCKEHGIRTRNLTMYLNLRSSDAPLGLCFNTAQYAYLLHMVGHVVNMDPYELITVGVDTHVYNNQIEKIEELLKRESHPDCDPRIVFKRKVTNIDDFKFEDIEIEGYHSQSKIDIPVAV